MEKKSFSKSTMIFIGIIVVIVLWAISGYNSLVNMDEGVTNKWSNVETQYQRRADLIPQPRQHRQGICQARTADS